jgi:2-dehydropantoate 2-reductase
MKIKKVALVGFGAIGCIYARNLSKKLGNDFAVIAGGKRAEKIRSNVVKVNGKPVVPQVISPDDKNWKADLVIFTVKNYQLAKAIEDVKGIVTENTIFLPLLNGVTAHDQIKETFKNNTVLYGIALGIDAVRTDGGITNRNDGVINFGEADNKHMSETVKEVKRVFDESEIANTVCEDMIRAIWKKWMINVSTNQLSAITKVGYGAFVSIPEMNEAMHQVMFEVIELAHKMRVNIQKEDAFEYDDILKTFDPDGKTSMLQDVENRRMTEVDYFAGTVIKFGKKAGVPTPWNDRIYLLIKGIEGNYKKLK